MGVAVLEQAAEREQGIRPLDILRDLDGVGQLIDLVFADDIARDGANLQRDLALLTAVSPFLWVLRRVSAEVRDAFDGFVWIEEGHVVGNVTLTRDDPGRNIWTITNVAVYPAYRRRGIARALMEACLCAVAERGGGLVVLEVKADNAAAYNLYLKLGFRYVDGQVTARLAGHMLRHPLELAQVPAVHRVTFGEGWKLWQLALATRSRLAQQITPLRLEDYSPHIMRWLVGRIRDVLSNERTIWLAIEEEDRFLAAAQIRHHAARNSSINMLIHPEGRNRVEASIIDAVLAVCAPLSKSITLQVASDQQKALDILQHHGFSVVRNLHRLMIEVTPAT